MDALEVDARAASDDGKDLWLRCTHDPSTGETRSYWADPATDVDHWVTYHRPWRRLFRKTAVWYEHINWRDGGPAQLTRSGSDAWSMTAFGHPIISKYPIT